MRQPETYVIYGANSCIGSELARAVLPDVKDLILFYHEKTGRIEDLFANGKVRAFQSDVREFEDFQEKMKKIHAEMELKDVGVVYLPAIRSYDHRPLSGADLNVVKEIIDTNFLGSINFLKAVLPLNKSAQSLRIVMMGSNVSRTGLKNGSVYAATKSAVSNLVRSVAMEEGCRNTFINTVSPGPVETDNSGYDSGYAQFRKEYFETQKALTSLNRVASAVDVCSLIRFLTSPENNHITGEELFVTGGAF
jgi:NAD(P)-dependent dehydrogenase (short-subunit alcohol dehydrogenase family)